MKQGHIGLVVLSDGKSLAPYETACWARDSVGESVVASSFRKKLFLHTYVLYVGLQTRSCCDVKGAG